MCECFGVKRKKIFDRIIKNEARLYNTGNYLRCVLDKIHVNMCFPCTEVDLSSVLNRRGTHACTTRNNDNN